ncbi:MAG TPA: cyclic pyranopterin monophosphate synthase MoaC [Acidimicrobiales bacterium]|nr:cyclic pyranopterin monophosphate synthase MoaC [Acidimicrobiales bacterium]
MDDGLTHLDERGKARMVDVTGKPVTLRRAVARCRVEVDSAVLGALTGHARGELVNAARNAGILAAKQTSRLVPLCHSIRVESVVVEITPRAGGFEVRSEARVHERTGVEMEALTACAAAALTVLAALRERDPTASIEDLTLWEKSGGRSGSWRRDAE